MLSTKQLVHTRIDKTIVYWRVYYAFGCLWWMRLDGGEKVCRRDGFAAVQKFKYPQKPVIHRQPTSPATDFIESQIHPHGESKAKHHQ